MIQISKMAYQFLKNAYEYRVDDFLDDPDGCTCNDPKLLVEEFRTLTKLGEELQSPFWKIAADVGTDYEINNLKQMLRDAGVKIK